MKKDNILLEITNYCEDCPNNSSCPEDECILYRIEQDALDQNNEYKEKLDDIKSYLESYDYDKLDVQSKIMATNVLMIIEGRIKVVKEGEDNE